MNQPERQACYMTKGERDLVLRALQYYAGEQQKMITAAWQKYTKGTDGKRHINADVFADHQRHHMNAIDAAESLRERFRNRSVFKQEEK